MTIEQSLIEAVRLLPPEKQRELLEHARQLRAGGAPQPSGTTPSRSTQAQWSGINVSITVEDTGKMSRQAVVRSSRGSFGRRDAKLPSDVRDGHGSAANGGFRWEEAPASQRS